MDPALASKEGVAFARGLQSASIIPVVKHFPGLGDAAANTDLAPAATLPLSTLKTQGLLPFQAAIAAGLPAIMVANAGVPGITGVSPQEASLPASLNPYIIGVLLRGDMGFHGLVITDSLTAGAIQQNGFTYQTASWMALKAGADMVLWNDVKVAAGYQSVVQAIVDAVGRGDLSRTRLIDAADHILTAKHVNLCS
jgi:beta-N-acetylhexosaminidase